MKRKLKKQHTTGNKKRGGGSHVRLSDWLARTNVFEKPLIEMYDLPSPNIKTNVIRIYLDGKVEINGRTETRQIIYNNAHPLYTTLLGALAYADRPEEFSKWKRLVYQSLLRRTY